MVTALLIIGGRASAGEGESIRNILPPRQTTALPLFDGGIGTSVSYLLSLLNEAAAQVAVTSESGKVEYAVGALLRYNTISPACGEQSCKPSSARFAARTAPVAGAQKHIEK
jgi:hypothetical protein